MKSCKLCGKEHNNYLDAMECECKEKKVKQRTVNLGDHKIIIKRNISGNFNIHVTYPDEVESNIIISKLEFDTMKELEAEALGWIIKKEGKK